MCSDSQECLRCTYKASKYNSSHTSLLPQDNGPYSSDSCLISVSERCRMKRDNSVVTKMSVMRSGHSLEQRSHRKLVLPLDSGWGASESSQGVTMCLGRRLTLGQTVWGCGLPELLWGIILSVWKVLDKWLFLLHSNLCCDWFPQVEEPTIWAPFFREH